MISAFGVDHGLVSKAESDAKIRPVKPAMPEKVPDWASGAMPASTARAYNYSENKKVKAAAHNFAWKTAGGVAGSAAGAALTGLAFRKAKPLKYMPKFFYGNSKVVNPLTGKKTTLTPGEKRRMLGLSLGGTFGTIGGGVAGSAQLHHMKSDPQYGYHYDKEKNRGE